MNHRRLDSLLGGHGIPWKRLKIGPLVQPRVRSPGIFRLKSEGQSHFKHDSFFVRNIVNNEALLLKGQSHEISKLGFVHQPASPGPDRDVPGHFRFLTNFRSRYEKTLLGILNTGESILSKYLNSRNT